MGSVDLNLPHRKTRFAPLTPEQFVFQITSGYDEIWFQRGRGSLLLVRYAGRRAAVLSLSLIEGMYGVVTAIGARGETSSDPNEFVALDLQGRRPRTMCSAMSEIAVPLVSERLVLNPIGGGAVGSTEMINGEPQIE